MSGKKQRSILPCFSQLPENVARLGQVKASVVREVVEDTVDEAVKTRQPVKSQRKLLHFENVKLFCVLALTWDLLLCDLLLPSAIK